MSKVTPFDKFNAATRQQLWYGHLTGITPKAPTPQALANAQRVLHEPVNSLRSSWDLINGLAEVLPSWKLFQEASLGGRGQTALLFHRDAFPVYCGPGYGSAARSVSFNSTSSQCPADFFSALCNTVGQAIPFPDHCPEPAPTTLIGQDDSLESISESLWISSEARRIMGQSFALQAMLEARSIGLEFHGSELAIPPVDLAYYRELREGGLGLAMSAHPYLIDPFARVAVQDNLQHHIDTGAEMGFWKSSAIILGGEWPRWQRGKQPTLPANMLDDSAQAAADDRGFFTKTTLEPTDRFFARRHSAHRAWITGTMSNLQDVEGAFPCLRSYAPALAKQLGADADFATFHIHENRVPGAGMGVAVLWPMSRFLDNHAEEIADATMYHGVSRGQFLLYTALSMWAGRTTIPHWPTLDHHTPYTLANGLFGRLMAMTAHIDSARFEFIHQAAQRDMRFDIPANARQQRLFLERHGSGAYAARIANLPGYEYLLPSFAAFAEQADEMLGVDET